MGHHSLESECSGYVSGWVRFGVAKYLYAAAIQANTKRRSIV